MRINYEKYGPGKFTDNVDEYMYDVVLDGGSEDIGDEWFGLYSCIDLSYEPLVVKYDDGTQETYVAATLYENDVGFVYVDAFRSLANAEKSWRKLEKEYEDFREKHAEEYAEEY